MNKTAFAFACTVFIALIVIPGMRDRFQGRSTILSSHERARTERKTHEREVARKENPEHAYQTGMFAIEAFVFPRTFNSSVPIGAGSHNAALAYHNAVDKASMNKSMAENPWTSLGPNNFGGRMRAVAYHPTNSNIVYAGAASGGVWKSFDGGLSWQPLTDFLPTLAIAAIKIDKKNPERIFIGTGEGSNNWDRVYGNGVYRSENGGASWTNILPILPNYDQVCNEIALHPESADTLFAAVAFATGTGGGIFKTTDGGTKWTNVLSGFGREVIIDPFNPRKVVAALAYLNGSGLNGIYRSDNNGLRFSFSKMTNGLPTSDSIGRIRIAASKSQQGLYLAVIVKASKHIPTSNQDLLGIYRTTNGGDFWERMAASDYSDMKMFMSSSGSSQGDYNLFVAIHPTNPNIYYLGGLNIWRSLNSGLTFQQISSSNSPTQPVHVDQHAIDFDPNTPTNMIVGNDGGIYRARNNTTASIQWEEGNQDLVTFQFYAMDYDKLKPTVVYGGTQDNGTNKGAVGSKAWAHILGGDGMTVVVDYTNSNIVYAESQFGAISKSTTGGSGFTSIRTGINYSVNPHWIAPFVMHPTNPQILFFGSNSIYKTTNGGGSWGIYSADLTGSTSSFSQITYIAIAKSEPNTVYCVTGNGRAWKSVNANATPVTVEWTRLNGLPGLYLTQVDVDPTDANRVYVATSSFDSTRNGVYASSDGGTSWTRKVPVGSDGKTLWRFGPVNTVKVSKKNPAHIYVGTDVGVFLSTNYGDTWAPFGKGLPTVVVSDIRLTESDVIYAATHGRGMWMASTILGIGEYHPTPGAYRLEQNYPNPIGAAAQLQSNATTISFSIPTRSNVMLTVYDLSGRRIRTLVNESRNPGSYAEIFDANDLPAGVYLYELRAGNFRDVKKMTVVK